ncbi:MAG: hypothetical protein KJ950_00010 [Proteobacteria bacterium]|nr:hypothetical protein [Pseudomonadota bacterium]MBU1687383.1 hypothetical protein [Pseudomonadota bacterium]
MKVLSTIIILVTLLTLPYLSAGQDEMPQDKTGIINWLKEKFPNMEISEIIPEKITVYCKVVDQTGAPVDGAKMKVSRSYISLPNVFDPVVEDEWFVADSTGMINFKTIVEDDVDIFEIEKKGYEFSYFFSPFYDLNEDEAMEAFKQSVNQPIVFTLRKLGPTTYVYKNEGGGRFSKPDSFVIYDIYDQGLYSIDRDLTKLRVPYRYDLILDVTKSTAGYTFKVLPVQDTGSMQAVDQLLYEAPQDGYFKEVALTLNVGEELETYLYFTSRDPAVYSRMKMELTATETDLRFRYETWTNPYGSRNLELEPDLPFDLYDKLRKEAEAALKSQKLPPEPDIPAMIASGQYN